MQPAALRWGRGFVAPVVLALAAAAAPAAPLPAGAVGVAAALGPAGVALGAALPAAATNPALLGDIDRATAALELGFDAGTSTPQRFGVRGPAAERAGFGLDFARTEFSTAASERQRSEWRLSGGRRLANAVALGADLRLRRETESGRSDTSHGLDVGVHARPGRFGMELGVVVRNAVRPRLQLGPEPETEPRLLQAAIAFSRDLPSAWNASAAAGISTSTSARGELWLGTRLASRRGIELGLGGSRHAQNLGVGVRLGAAALEIVAGRAGTAGVATAVRWAFGGSRAARRLDAERRADTDFSARIDREIEARKSRRIESWRAEAAVAAAHGANASAVELYRNVLLWNPDDAAARDGLRRAQRNLLLQQADSLIAQRDYWSASSSLAGILREFPDDSLATARLQTVRKAMRRADRTRSEAAEQLRLGLEAYAAQRYAAALRCFEAAHALDPRSAAAVEFRDHARAAVERQIASGLAQARERLERGAADSARVDVEAVLAVAPKRPEALALRAQIERESERLALERRRSRQVDGVEREDRAPVPPAVLASGYEQGLQLYRAGDLVAAMRAWEDVARLAPHYEDVDRYLLRVYRVCGLERYTEGRLQDAIEIWEKALRLEPDNAQMRRYLNQANAKMKRAHGPRGNK